MRTRYVFISLGMCLLPWALPAKEPPAKEPPAVLELLEDDIAPLIPQLNNDGGLDATKASVELRDVFSGAGSLRVTAMQRFSARLPNWNHAILENPGPGQYRYLRFAWKRTGSPGIMIQLHRADGSWNQRYLAGQASPSVMAWGQMMNIGGVPGDWEIVTRDLVKDFGAMHITGMAFTPMEGDGVGLFDHFYLGRTLADLDRVTDQVLGKVPLAKPLSPEELQTLWKDLASAEPGPAGKAWRTLVAGRKDSVPFLREQFKKISKPEAQDPKTGQWIAALDDDEFQVREEAFRELKKLGAAAAAPMRKAFQETTSPEVKRRLEILLEKFAPKETEFTPEQLRLARSIRVLEKSGTPQARAILEELGRQTLEAGLNDDVRRALGRLSKK